MYILTNLFKSFMPHISITSKQRWSESFWKLLDNAAFLRTHLEIKQVESLSTEFDSLSHGLGICQGAAFPCPGTGIIMSYVYITLLRFRAEILVNMGMLTLIMATLG